MIEFSIFQPGLWSGNKIYNVLQEKIVAFFFLGYL